MRQADGRVSAPSCYGRPYHPNGWSSFRAAQPCGGDRNLPLDLSGRFDPTPRHPPWRIEEMALQPYLSRIHRRPVTAARPDTPAQQLSLGLGAMTMSAHSGQERTRIYRYISPYHWWRVVQEKEIHRSLDPAKAFVDVDGAARSPAPAEIRQLAPDAMAPLAQQPSYYPGEGVWSSLLHQNSKRQFCTAPLVAMLREPPQEFASRLDRCAERRLDSTTFRGLTLASQSCAVAWACDRRRPRHPRSHVTICASSRCTAGARG